MARHYGVSRINRCDLLVLVTFPISRLERSRFAADATREPAQKSCLTQLDGGSISGVMIEGLAFAKIVLSPKGRTHFDAMR